MKANEASVEAVALVKEIGRDEGKDVLWEAVDGNKRVSPLTNSHQDGGNILVQLRNLVKAIAMEEVRKSISKALLWSPQ